MGRGRGKSKKQNVVPANDESRSGEEQKIPVSKRRARTQKPVKGDLEEDVMVEKLEIAGENAKSLISRSVKDEIAEENCVKKRKSFPQVKDNLDPAEVENASGAKSIAESPIKAAGFRQTGSRRKSTPRRAAEVGVECS